MPSGSFDSTNFGVSTAETIANNQKRGAEEMSGNNKTKSQPTKHPKTAPTLPVPTDFDDLLRNIPDESDRKEVGACIMSCIDDLRDNAVGSLMMALGQSLGAGKIKSNEIMKYLDIPNILNRAGEIAQRPAAAGSTAQTDQYRHSDNFYQINEWHRGADNFDLIRFSERVSRLFEWHVNVRGNDQSVTQYLYPVLAIIQSSGTGKTKLLWDYITFCADQRAMKQSITSRLPHVVIYRTCIRRPNGKGDEHFLNLNSISRMINFDDQRKEFTSKLDDIIGAERRRLSVEDDQIFQVVLLIDEAQELTKENNSFLYRVLRWYLCEKRHCQNHIVAVTAGTNSSLADAFPENKEETKSSRVAVIDSHYEPQNAKFAFPPFVDLWTMGCLSKSVTFADKDDRFREYEKSIPYGRPYFTTLVAPRQNNTPQSDVVVASQQISNAEHANILARMMLNKVQSGELEASLLACISILGTRVQLGGTHSSVTSELVAKGYAHLTFFESSPPNLILPSTARFAYLPDPVCARLAMCMMDEGWRIEAELQGGRGSATSAKVKSINVSGRSKQFWANQLAVSLSSGLCQPPKGNKGEVFAALYMLFCGDVLRKAKNDDYWSFAVPLESWVKVMENNGSDNNNNSHSNKTALQVSFIQICRNNMRNKLKERTSQSSLKLLYDMKIMSYAYNDHPGIDLIGSAIVPSKPGMGSDTQPRYIGIYVSVKNDFERTSNDIVNDSIAMIKLLEDAGVKCGLILFINFGRTNKSKPGIPDNYVGNNCYEPFVTEPSDLHERFVSRIIDVEDIWNLAETLEQTVSDGTAVAEQYSSHPLLETSSSNVLSAKKTAGRFRPKDSVCTPDDNDVEQVIENFIESRKKRNVQEDRAGGDV